jgi:hypothetical protein
LRLIFSLWTLLLPYMLGNDAPSIQGYWSDVCPCTVPCPCWKTGHANAKICLNVHIFRITKGEYGGVTISGAKFVLINRSDRAYEAPRPQIVIIDKTVDEPQAVAISQFVNSRAHQPVSFFALFKLGRRFLTSQLRSDYRHLRSRKLTSKSFEYYLHNCPPHHLLLDLLNTMICPVQSTCGIVRVGEFWAAEEGDFDQRQQGLHRWKQLHC